MAKIAVELQDALRQRAIEGTAGATIPRVLARGDGWSVADVICTSGPDDRRFEEQHLHYSVAVVLAGTFQLRTSTSDALMVPGSLMLGNHGQCFECGHEHGEGDRCVSFYFEPEFFARLARDAGIRNQPPRFVVSRLRPMREFSGLIADVYAGLDGTSVAWEELALRLATAAVARAAGDARCSATPRNALPRITDAVRAIDRQPAAAHSIATLARHAGLSPFHFLRTFERVVGVTPHQYLRRMRLRQAASRLVTTPDNVVDIALDSGFGDVSNFNHAFRGEFGLSPTHLRRRHVRHPGHTEAQAP